MDLLGGNVAFADGSLPCKRGWPAEELYDCRIQFLYVILKPTNQLLSHLQMSRGLILYLTL